jgi:hypothetical protein
MKYIPKTVRITVTIPNTEVGATDYIYIFSNNGEGDVDLVTPFSPKIRGLANATNFVYVCSFQVSQPGLWKFKYTVYDAAGNAGTTSGEFPIAWANSTAYVAHSSVIGYECILAHTSGGDSEWTADIPYALGDRVYVGARNDTTYICTTATDGDETFPSGKFTADNDEPGVGSEWETYWVDYDLTMLVPSKAPALKYVSYNDTTKILKLTA